MAFGGYFGFSLAALLSRPGVDGALIGGASLIANEFLAIARSAIAETVAQSV
jgi:triosephosphate isomerase